MAGVGPCAAVWGQVGVRWPYIGTYVPIYAHICEHICLLCAYMCSYVNTFEPMCLYVPDVVYKVQKYHGWILGILEGGVEHAEISRLDLAYLRG